MLSFKQLTEKKTKVLINPKKSDLQEKEVNHGEDCDCKKCEAKRRGEEVNDGPDIATEQKENKNCGCGKDPCETYGMKEGKEIPANVKKIAKELDKAVAMHKSQAQRLRKAGVSEMHNTCPEGQYYCHDMKKCKPIPKGAKLGKDGMLVKEEPEVYWSSEALDQLDQINERQKDSDNQRLSQERGRSNYGKASIRNMRATGTGGNAADPAERLVAMDARHKAHKEKRGVKTKGMKEDLTAKDRFKRDAGAIAKKKIRNKEHRKYVNFLDVDENTIHSFNTFIQSNKPYDSQKEVSEESDKESKVETSLLRFSECWKTHKKVGMKMKGGKLVNDCRPKNEAKEYTGPDKKDRALIKKMDNPSYAKRLADYEKNMDPKKRQALRDKATKGMKFTHEETLSELKMPKDTKYHKMSYKDLKKTHKDFKNMDSTPPRVTTLDKKTNATVSRPVKFVPDKKKTNEAANPAQQAAIAIDMKKKGKKPKDVQEATRLKKEMGYDKGGTKKPTAPKQKDTALDLVKKSITAKYGKGAIMSGGSRQQKKVKGQKDDRGTGKFKKAADAKKQTAADAKKRGFKDVKSYVNTMARYGGKDNYDKGKGLGS